MAVKQVRVVTPGGDLAAYVPVEPDTTAADALRQVGLEGDFALCTADGKAFFQPADKLDRLVRDGATLHAVPWARVGTLSPEAMLAVILVAGAVVAVLIIALVANDRPSPTSETTPSSKEGVPYWRRTGWQQSGHRYAGCYSAGDFRLPGKIRFRSAWDCAFEIHAPSNLIAACGKHRRCFLPVSRPHARGWRWYSVHFNRRPRTVCSGIVAVEAMLGWAAGRLEGDLT